MDMLFDLNRKDDQKDELKDRNRGWDNSLRKTSDSLFQGCGFKSLLSCRFEGDFTPGVNAGSDSIPLGVPQMRLYTEVL